LTSVCGITGSAGKFSLAIAYQFVFFFCSLTISTQ